MNSVFNFNRWYLYTAKHWNENYKKYLLSLTAIAGLLIIWYSFLIFFANFISLNDLRQVITFYSGLFISGCFFASIFFSDLSGGPRAIHYLMEPASLFEKLLTALLFAVLLFFVCYLAIFYLVDVPMVKLSNSVAMKIAERDHKTPEISTVINVFVSPKWRGDNYYIYFLLCYIALQSAFLLGSVYFSRYSFIKTAISLFVVFAFFLFLIKEVFGPMLPQGDFFEPFQIYRIYGTGGTDKAVTLPHWPADITIFLLEYAMAPVFWVVIYFRLKEKEV